MRSECEYFGDKKQTKMNSLALFKALRNRALISLKQHFSISINKQYLVVFRTHSILYFYLFAIIGQENNRQ